MESGTRSVPCLTPNQMDSFADISDRDRIRVSGECLARRLAL